MMRKSRYLILLLWALSNRNDLIGQTALWVYFTDKQHNDFSLAEPSAFLSEASLARREKTGVALSMQDLPVSELYVAELNALGVQVRSRSKWLNAVGIQHPGDSLLAIVSALPFVADIQEVKHYVQDRPEEIPLNDQLLYRAQNDVVLPYGGAENQIRMIEVDFLHQLGHRGQGVKIAVLDGGFYGVDWGAGFASLRDKGQIRDVFNLAENNTDVYISSTHGSNVLSIMAVDMPGVYMGSAPDAEYYLYRTEVTSSEYVVEEDYWMQAAEMADSVGADIINSSLGYTTFDDTAQDHTYADMDGNTTVVTKAADHAASLGILVVNSAGNSGDDTWNFIGAPADGDSVFTIGAVDYAGDYVSFSSEGPTADGRIKPNVTAQGSGSAYVNADGSVGYGSGTSYSSPLIAGACASFMSAFPELTNMQVMQLLQSTASHAAFPDNQYGWGIPGFARAYLEQSGITISEENILTIMPNPAEDYVNVYINGVESATVELALFDLSGRRLAEAFLVEEEGGISVMQFNGLELLGTGIYVVRLSGNAYSEASLLFVR